MKTTNEISRNLRVVFWEEFMGPEMIIGEKFPRFGKIFTPGSASPETGATQSTGLELTSLGATSSDEPINWIF